MFNANTEEICNIQENYLENNLIKKLFLINDNDCKKIINRMSDNNKEVVIALTTPTRIKEFNFSFLKMNEIVSIGHYLYIRNIDSVYHFYLNLNSTHNSQKRTLKLIYEDVKINKDNLILIKRKYMSKKFRLRQKDEKFFEDLESLYNDILAN